MKKTLSKIRPTDSQKEKILQNVRNKQSGGLFVLRFATLAVFTLMFVLSSSIEEIKEVIPISRNINQINYNSICYNGVIGDYEVGKLIDEVLINDEKNLIYLNNLDDKTILIYNNGYNLYVECEEF